MILRYLNNIGQLLWISKVRCDISFAVHYLCCKTMKPSDEDWIKLKRVFRYLKGTLNREHIFKRSGCSIIGFSDSSLADLDNYHSTGCSLIFVGSNLILH